MDMSDGHKQLGTLSCKGMGMQTVDRLRLGGCLLGPDQFQPGSSDHRATISAVFQNVPMRACQRVAL
jgi:hypothetical protein